MSTTRFSPLLWSTSCLLTIGAYVTSLEAAALVPGTGEQVEEVGDDLEDEAWNWIPNSPKSSHEQDERTRGPGGRSENGRWLEGSKRGQPDIVRRVPTPPGGLSGSQGALLIQSRDTGIPGRPTGRGNQDDLLLNIRSRLRRFVPISASPSGVVRVYVPEFDQWEKRRGTSFAFRAGLRGGPTGEPYWPGIFFQYRGQKRVPVENPAEGEPTTRLEHDVQLIIRADHRGRDFWGPKVTQPGWWTLGMSFTPDGRVHYYARPGVEDLRPEDHLSSQTPYGWRARNFNTLFFNVVSADDGRTWSTPWVIDDPTFYTIQNVVRQPRQRRRR